jgi:hypothetical protein
MTTSILIRLILFPNQSKKESMLPSINCNCKGGITQTSTGATTQGWPEKSGDVRYGQDQDIEWMI